METIHFSKMSGAGNDFVVIDHRTPTVPEGGDLTRFLVNVCRRGLSVGADGVILIEDSQRVDFKWRFYNNDGSVAEMCGNGARCAARFAHLNAIAGPRMAFETVAGIVEAHVVGERVKIKMTDPTAIEGPYPLELKSGTLQAYSVNTGVPHVVVEVDDIEAVDVIGQGREIRYHTAYAPAGTNANFISRNDDALVIRTYERGVENETLACGTGSVAAALVAAHRTGQPSPVEVITRSGARLGIYFNTLPSGYRDVFLEGDARLIYSAELHPEAWRDGS